MDDDATRDLATTPLHLGLGGIAVPLDGFAWDPAYLADMDLRFAADGDEGRLVTLGDMDASWDSWERHPAGEEVVLCLDGRCRLWQDLGGEERSVDLVAGRYVVNPAGVWHTADIDEPVRVLFITPGRGTEHRPR